MGNRYGKVGHTHVGASSAENEHFIRKPRTLQRLNVPTYRVSSFDDDSLLTPDGPVGVAAYLDDGGVPALIVQADACTIVDLRHGDAGVVREADYGRADIRPQSNFRLLCTHDCTLDTQPVYLEMGNGIV